MLWLVGPVGNGAVKLYNSLLTISDAFLQQLIPLQALAYSISAERLQAVVPNLSQPCYTPTPPNQNKPLILVLLAAFQTSLARQQSPP